MKKTLIIVAILVVVIAVGIFLSQTSGQPVVTNDLASVPGDAVLLANMHMAGLEPLGAEGTVMHIHEHLDISINGKKFDVPASLGIGSSFISAMHTHDNSGILHVESPVKKDFKLTQLFQEWGVNLDNNKIANYAADQNNSLIFAVNGKQITDITNYVVSAHDEIQIWYGSKDQAPTTFIASYNFPAGL